jgi:tetratricopeptide (TPR) repeat protein/transcriptional regulator with XRE-family HTH domain
MDQTQDIFFGTLLRDLRKRKKLSQQQVAKNIGVNRDSISSWERGEYFPETPTMLHELARVLQASDDEKRLLFEALYGTASMLPLHNLPEHNPYFTGREQVLHNLHTQLTAKTSVALVQTQAISGLGGIGKTQVALEYAYRFRKHYQDILWAQAETRETLISSYITFAKYLRLRECEEQEYQKVITAVKRWFREHKGWLLILDNIEDLGLMREFLPPPRQGAVLLTTRRAETAPLAQTLLLDVLPEEEGMLFLLRRASILGREETLETVSSSQREIARVLVRAVGGLPLALDQAGAYLAETRCSLAHYLDLFQNTQLALLQRRGTLSIDHPHSVATTFALVFEQVQQKSEDAIQLLICCSFLAPDDIPLELFSQRITPQKTELEQVRGEPLLLDQMIEILRTFSLVRRDGEGHTLSIHRLVQTVLKEQLPEEKQRNWAEYVVRSVNELFPEVNMLKTWNVCQRLLPHALVCMTWIDHWHIETAEVSRLLYQVGAYLEVTGNYTLAEQFLQRAYEMRVHLLGTQHVDTLATLNTLGELYLASGKYGQAELLFQQVLSLRENTLGAEHLDVASSLNNLAGLYDTQSDFVKAEPLYKRALAIREAVLGREHPVVATSLNNLGALYYQQGKYSETEPYFLRALLIREKELGENHPHVATSLNNLAKLYSMTERVDESILLYQRALNIHEQVFSDMSPHVAVTLSNLAKVYNSRCMYQEAEQFHRRALRIKEHTFGEEHIEVANSLHLLAQTYVAQGKYEQAEPLFERAQTICERTVGQEHLLMASVLKGRAEMHLKQGQLQQADMLYQRILRVQGQRLGKDHPLIMDIAQHYAHLLYEQEAESALKLNTTHNIP